MRLRHWLPLLLAGLALLLAQDLPLLDEESYLDIASQLDWLRPYDWWRPWQPWGASHPPDAFLYAHPPLHLWWIKLWGGWRPGATIPWALLLGWAVGDLCERRPRATLLALGWASSPVLWLALQAGMMIDLGVVALSTAAVALWKRERWLLAGLALGAACSTKYPALVLLPVLAIDAWRTGHRPWKALLGFSLVWGGVELFLAAQYGRFHLLDVLLTAPQLARGPMLSRGLGTVFRLGFLPVAGSPIAALGVVPALLTPQDGGAGGFLTLTLLGGVGLSALVLAAKALRDPEDGLWGLWVLAVVAGVVLGHNYVGGRYLLPAMAPLVMLLWRIDRRILIAGMALQLALAVGMVRAERTQARAATELAERVEGEQGRFTGEWSFRYAMRQRGWVFWSPEEHLESGTLVAVPTNASPGPVPEGWILVDELESPERDRLRVLDLDAGIGYHADTLGPLPIGLGAGPVERVRVFRVP